MIDKLTLRESIPKRSAATLEEPRMTMGLPMSLSVKIQCGTHHIVPIRQI